MDRLKPLGLLLLRCALAVIFIWHGYQKYAHGTEGVKAYMSSTGLPSYFAYIAIGLEIGGGVLLLAGLATRPIAILLAGEMVIAIWKAHMGGGIAAVSQYEFAMICGAACFALATTGAGSASLDAMMFGRRSGAKAKA
ncbi:MAG: DoxX family protein [Candidatus Acidiferrales bacterium]